MMLAGILLSERAVEELVFLLLDADEIDLALRLTHASNVRCSRSR